MKINKIPLAILLLLCVNLIGEKAFAGTGGPNDGQIMLVAILALLSIILCILYFSPRLVHWISELWKKHHHC
jgi:sterol desaturase/sphingolipid hydroxylase (fatty acid hydroxylase superfamily)